MRKLAPLALTLLACTSQPPFLSVDLGTDLLPGGDFTRVRTEVSETPVGSGALSVQQVERDATSGEDFGTGVRVAELALPTPGVWYMRVSLMDASGRIRGQRLATVEVTGFTAVTIVIGSACNGVVCPGSGDPEDATTCVNGTCVPPTCTPEAPESCPPIGCATEADCGTGFDCHHPACVSGTCLMLDACPDGGRCTELGCMQAPRCGDGSCDPGSETPCLCPTDCGACPPSCGDGACDVGEGSTGCPEDCGPPPSMCGDAICEFGEPCPEDCPGARPVACGDPGCTSCDECDACCDAGCGDGACNEDPASCPADCGPLPPVCGDTRCDIGESCSADCQGPICGDGFCADGVGESCGNCQDDCGWCGLGWPKVSSLRVCTGPSGYRRGARCSGLAAAWHDTADNVAYYPMITIRDTPIATGERASQVLSMLPPTTPVAIQSTRNPLCHDSPPLRPAIDGWVLGYIRGSSTGNTGIGWLRLEDLLFDPRGGPCANGPGDGAFQVATNPYSRNPICEPLDCDGERRCREINPPGEGAVECDGTVVDYERIVDQDYLHVRYSPAGSPRRFLHRGDRVRVRYESPDHDNVFVTALTSAAPRLTPVGSKGWVYAGALRAP